MMDFHNWPVFLLDYVGFVAIMYFAAWCFLRLGTRRDQASMAMAAAPQVRARFQPYMEGLRGIMALNIFYFHATAWFDWHHGGNGYPSDTFNEKIGVVGLCYFLFMTGYLLWKGIITEWGSTFHVGRFLKGRFYRTFPAYAVTITFIFVTSLAFAGWRLQVPAWKFCVSYVSWILFALPGGFAINGINEGLLGARVMWTMQMDWMFYLLVPFLLWFGRKRGRILILAAISFSLFYIINTYLPHRTVIYHRLSLFSFIFTGLFLLGMMLAELQRVFPQWPWARTRAASAVALVLYFLLLFYPTTSWTIHQQVILMPVFALLAYGSNVFGLLDKPAVLLLGRISYSVYLYHSWVLIIVSHALGRLGHPPEMWPRQRYMLLATGIGVVVLVVAYLSHRFVEMQFTTIGKVREARRAVGSPQNATPRQVEAAVEEEAAQLPGMAEAEALLPQHRPGAAN